MEGHSKINPPENEGERGFATCARGHPLSRVVPPLSPCQQNWTKEKESPDFPNRCPVSCDCPGPDAEVDSYHVTCEHTPVDDKANVKWLHGDDTPQRAQCPPISHDSSDHSSVIWAKNILGNFDNEHQAQGPWTKAVSLNSCESDTLPSPDQKDDNANAIVLCGKCGHTHRWGLRSASYNTLISDEDDLYKPEKFEHKKAQNHRELYQLLVSSGSDSDGKVSPSAEICTDVRTSPRGFLRRTLGIPRNVRNRLSLTYPAGIAHFYSSCHKSDSAGGNQHPLLRPRKCQSHSLLTDVCFTERREPSNNCLCQQTKNYKLARSTIHNSLEGETREMYKSTDLLCDDASAHPSCSVPKGPVFEHSPLKTQRRGETFNANIIYDLFNHKNDDNGDSKEDVGMFSTKIIEPSKGTGASSRGDITTQDCQLPPFGLSRLLDFALAYLWVGPLVTVYWCNSWHIPENYLLPVDPVISGWISGAVGYTLYFLASFFQEGITSFTINRTRPMQFVIVQAYSYVMCWACVHQWRCVWVLLDEYTGVSTMNAAVTYASATTLLVILRSHKGTASAPATVRMDVPVEKHFFLGKYFDAKSGTWRKIGDSLFSVVVIDSLVISVWRGLWEVLDMELSPDVKSMSGVWSLVISYGLAVVLFVTQVPIRRTSIYLENVHWLVHLAFEDVITILYTVVAITHWRGYWTLMDVYLPYKPVSHWFCHGASFVLLALGLAATSVPVLGCIRDGRLSNGQGVVFDNFYFSHLRNAWLSRKSKQRVHSNDDNGSKPFGEYSNGGRKDFITSVDVSSHDVMAKQNGAQDKIIGGGV